MHVRCAALSLVNLFKPLSLDGFKEFGDESIDCRKGSVQGLYCDKPLQRESHVEGDSCRMESY
jgi:hypothetical protein